jgi:DNA-binding winged helix-turn-helix (wHTH) protein
MARVWPDTFVEPANLTVHMSALRRMLRDGRDGNRFIINVPGRGYSFVASVEVSVRENRIRTALAAPRVAAGLELGHDDRRRRCLVPATCEKSAGRPLPGPRARLAGR